MCLAPVCMCASELIVIRAVDCGLPLVQTIIFPPVNSRSVLQTHLLARKYASIKCVQIKQLNQASQHVVHFTIVLLIQCFIYVCCSVFLMPDIC